MKFLCLLFLSLSLFAADTIPGRYIVELSTESVAAHVRRIAPRSSGPLALHTAAADQHRTRIRSEQAAATAAIQRAAGQVTGAVENYLHEMALAHQAPSGTVYDPAKTGKPLASLGVHEHWNNATDKKYSRNLGKGSGIELVSVKIA